jgi:hypothetical protein
MRSNHHTTRKTLATSTAKAAPLRIILFTLPIWGISIILMLFMPLTGIISFVTIAVCLLWLPFTAKRGACPQCDLLKTFAFSGIGSACKGCGADLVLRNQHIHHIEPKKPRYGSGRAP